MKTVLCSRLKTEIQTKHTHTSSLNCKCFVQQTSERQHTSLFRDINLDLDVDRSQLCNQVTENVWHFNFLHFPFFLANLTMNIMYILISTPPRNNHWCQDAATCLTQQHL